MTSPALGRIVEEYSDGGNRIALVEFDGKRRAVYLNLVPDARVGDCIRFHAGFATERVSSAPGQGPCGDNASVAHRAEVEEAVTADLTLPTGRAYKLLSDLDPEQLRKLLLIAHEKQFAAGQSVFHSGDQSSFLHLIVSGDVVLEELTGETPTAVQTLHPGDALGWSALTPGSRTHFEARALSPVTTIAFPGDQLRIACENDPAMGYALMKRLVELVTERLDALRIKFINRAAPA
jgi:CRP-like cAMP-binding protein